MYKIDGHSHPDFHHTSFEEFLDNMEENGISKSCIMTWENPWEENHMSNKTACPSPLCSQVPIDFSRVLAYYVDGIAVYNRGKVSSFMENGELNRASAFYMVDVPSPKRQAGWPLNSISINANTNDYFVDGGNNKYDPVREDIMIGEYRKRVIAFLKSSLGIE